MTIHPLDASRPEFLRTWLLWTAGFLAFPLAGLAGGALAGRVDDPLAGLVGGAVSGLVIGAGQVLVSRRRLDPRRWIAATTLGMALGLLLGSLAAEFRTALADLALMGVITGLVLGAAQAWALPRRVRYRWAWVPAMAALWALGWTATTLAGVDVEAQYTNFGAIGAFVFSALSGIVLYLMLPFRPASGVPAASSQIGASS